MVAADFMFSGPLEGGEVDGDLLDHVPAVTEDTVASNLCILPKLPRGPTQAAAARHNNHTNGPRVDSWFVDSGSPLDLVDREDSRTCSEHITKGSRVRLATANGETIADQVLPLHLTSLGEDIDPMYSHQPPTSSP